MAELSGKEIPVSLESEVKDSYLTYAMSVIVSRALPDVRDGLKPVHRRLLYAMNEMGLRPDRPYRKTARLIGDVLGKYHPHGDLALYEALVRLAQDFSLRYPVVDGQGNFGSVDGDPPAAMRYTEARLAPFSEAMLRDIAKDTVDFVPNYDDSLTEPSVLPAAFPFLLANGSSGIAVGMATNMPPHNLGEVAGAIVAMIEKPEISSKELMNHVRGPDFPTGGVIFGQKGIEDAFTSGRGRVVVRGRTVVEALKNGKEAIIITEIPYLVNKSSLIVRIADLVRDRKVEGISDLRDESDRQGMRIVIEIRRKNDPEHVLRKLYSLTQLQDAFNVNALALVGGRPQLLTLRDMVGSFIQHRKQVVTRRAQFDLKKAEQRELVLEGLKVALDNIDEVVAIIRGSQDVQVARDGLMAAFGLSEVQARAILDMRLQRLTSLEVKKIETELVEVRENIRSLRELLGSENKILGVIREETVEIASSYSDPRRTEIVSKEAEDYNYEDLIEKEDMVVQISSRGIVKRVAAKDFRLQKKGGKGAGNKLKNTDFIAQVFIGSTHDLVLFITSVGKAYWLKVYELPERTRQAVGQDMRSLLALGDGEEVTEIVRVNEFADNQYLFMVTAFGVAKKVRTVDFRNAKRHGIAAINLDRGDRLVSAMLTDGAKDVVVMARSGKALRFSEAAVRATGRSSRGVRGIRLLSGDSVCGAAPADPLYQMFVISRLGYGKRVEFSSLAPHGRGTAGQYCYKDTEKTGPVVDMMATQKENLVFCITEKGKSLKLPQKGIPILGRSASGVRVVNLDSGDSVVGVARVDGEP